MAVEWHAKWIGPAQHPKEDLGVFGYRTRFRLEEIPDVFWVRVSADNRYKLYVNGELALFGPQRGDERHWFYESIDLAPYLRSGDNWIAALVWNFGRWAPMAQHSARTGFVLEGLDDDRITTPGLWEVARMVHWDYDMMHSGIGEFYIDVGPGEIIDGRNFPWGWETGRDPLGLADTNSSEGYQELPPNEVRTSIDWKSPHVICAAEERGNCTGGTPWMMIPRAIPLMRYDRRLQLPTIRHGFLGDALSHLPDRYPASYPLSMGAGKMLLDFGELLCAYPRLKIAKGSDATVTLTYAEALWQLDGQKGNRNDVSGKVVRGYQDRIHLGSVKGETYEPLWWRTFRYVLVDIEAGPSLRNIEKATDFVQFEAFDAFETGYPLSVESSFEANDPAVKLIWDVSVRTAKRCAGETYFDCPYYEQLQYVGDTRIQALIGYYIGPDRALTRNAIETLGWSLMENGLTQSRYPSRQTQIIPPFSLWWVMMLYDEMMYDSARDIAWLEPEILVKFYELLTDRNAGEDYWLFLDWVPGWYAGISPHGKKSLEYWVQYFLARDASLILSSRDADPWNDISSDRIELVRELAKNGVSVCGPRDPYSEHVEALIRNWQQLLQLEPDPWPTDALAAANAAKCTYYFSYYKHLAMFGRKDAPFDYMQELEPWKEMIESGLSTFAETPEPTRSDCHAWSAHPILGFFQIVAGVTSLAPAWQKARIMPHPGSLNRFDARISHPKGPLRVAFENGTFEIESPVPFEFRWQDKDAAFESGKHSIG